MAPSVTVLVQGGHKAQVAHRHDRTRAACSCGWFSPWCTAGPPQPDVPPRDNAVERALRAARWHVSQGAAAAEGWNRR
jgi:hypothetical protein